MKQVFKLGWVLILCLSFICLACHKDDYPVKLLLMPTQQSNAKFHVIESHYQYYTAVNKQGLCSGSDLGVGILTGGTWQFHLPNELRFSRRSAARVAYTNRLVPAADLSSIHCIQAKILGSQDGKQYVSKAVDFPVTCSGVCPDDCDCVAAEQGAYKKTYFTEMNIKRS